MQFPIASILVFAATMSQVSFAQPLRYFLKPGHYFLNSTGRPVRVTEIKETPSGTIMQGNDGNWYPSNLVDTEHLLVGGDARAMLVRSGPSRSKSRAEASKMTIERVVKRLEKYNGDLVGYEVLGETGTKFVLAKDIKLGQDQILVPTEIPKVIKGASEDTLVEVSRGTLEDIIIQGTPSYELNQVMGALKARENYAATRTAQHTVKAISQNFPEFGKLAGTTVSPRVETAFIRARNADHAVEIGGPSRSTPRELEIPAVAR